MNKVSVYDCSFVELSKITVGERKGNLTVAYNNESIPFDVKLPIEKPIGLATMTIEEMDAELEKGYMDILEGNVKPARQAFADIRRDFNL